MAWYVDGLDDGRIRRWTSIVDDDADNGDVDLDTGGDVDKEEGGGGGDGDDADNEDVDLDTGGDVDGDLPPPD